MIEINNYWRDEIKDIVSKINQSIEKRDSAMFKGMVLELMKLLNPKHSNEIHSSAAWAFVDISEIYPKQLKNIIPTIIDLLNESDILIVTYALNTLDNLYDTYPTQVARCLPELQDCVASFDANLRRICLDFIDKMADTRVNQLRNHSDLIEEIKLSTKDLDSSLASSAKSILTKIGEGD